MYGDRIIQNISIISPVYVFKQFEADNHIRNWK